MAVLRLSGALPRGLVKENGCRGRGVERFDAAGHGNADARIGATLDVFRQASAFVADEQRDWLRPINFPGREQRLIAVSGFMNAGRECAYIGNAKLREENRQRHPGENRKMQRGASRCTQGLWRKWTGRANLAGGRSNRARRAE